MSLVTIFPYEQCAIWESWVKIIYLYLRKLMKMPKLLINLCINWKLHQVFQAKLFIMPIFYIKPFKGCVRYIFASLIFLSKREHLWNKEECVLFHLKSSFHSWDNQILTIQMLQRHQMPKHETQNTFYRINWEVKTVW